MTLKELQELSKQIEKFGNEYGNVWDNGVDIYDVTDVIDKTIKYEKKKQ